LNHAAGRLGVLMWIKAGAKTSIILAPPRSLADEEDVAMVGAATGRVRPTEKVQSRSGHRKWAILAAVLAGVAAALALLGPTAVE
jgi:hypothetical protein